MGSVMSQQVIYWLRVFRPLVFARKVLKSRYFSPAA